MTHVLFFLFFGKANTFLSLKYRPKITQTKAWSNIEILTHFVPTFAAMWDTASDARNECSSLCKFVNRMHVKQYIIELIETICPHTVYI